MSTDATVTKDLVETLRDSEEGFAKSADKLASSGSADLASRFRRLGAQRAQFAEELQELAKDYGDEVDERGSVAGSLHRGWLSLKDALAGSSAEGLLDAAEQGEDHAVEEYEKALRADLSATLRAVVERQHAEVKAAHDEVKSLRNAHR